MKIEHEYWKIKIGHPKNILISSDGSFWYNFRLFLSFGFLVVIFRTHLAKPSRYQGLGPASMLMKLPCEFSAFSWTITRLRISYFPLAYSKATWTSVTAFEERLQRSSHSKEHHPLLSFGNHSNTCIDGTSSSKVAFWSGFWAFLLPSKVFASQCVGLVTCSFPKSSCTLASNLLT